MGSSVRAFCPCGVDEEILIGGGMLGRTVLDRRYLQMSRMPEANPALRAGEHSLGLISSDLSLIFYSKEKVFFHIA